MAKVLVAFCNGLLRYQEENDYRIPIFFETFIKGLLKQGNDVLMFQHRAFNTKFPDISIDMKDEIQAFEPDLCVLFNNAFFDLTRVVECPILIYAADTPIFLLTERGNDFFFALREDSEIDYVTENYNVSSEKIMKITSFTEVRNKELKKERNISFIGTKFSAPEAGNRLMSLCIGASAEKREKIRGVLNTLCKNPFYSDQDISNLYPELEFYNNGVSVQGLVALLSGEKRIHILSCIKDLGLELFGKKDWLDDYYYDTELMLCFNDRDVVTLRDNEEIYNTSKIGISIAHTQATYGFPWRVMDIMGSSALLISDYHVGINDCFQGVEIPMYKDMFQARDLCKYYLEHEKERRDIVLECNKIIESKYRLINLLQLIGQNLDIKLLNNKKAGTIKTLFVDQCTYEYKEYICNEWAL